MKSLMAGRWLGGRSVPQSWQSNCRFSEAGTQWLGFGDWSIGFRGLEFRGLVFGVQDYRVLGLGGLGLGFWARWRLSGRFSFFRVASTGAERKWFLYMGATRMPHG